MEIKLSVYAEEENIYRNRYAANFETLGDVQEAEVEINTAYSRLHFIEKWFNGVHISIVEVEPDGPAAFVFEFSQQHIAFLFCLSGGLSYQCNANGEDFLSLAKNEQHLNLGKVNRFAWNVNEKTRYVYVQLTEAYFHQVMNQDFSTSVKPAKESISAEVALTLQHMINHKYEGRVKRLFLAARVFDLIVHISQKADKPAVILKEDDVNKIILARQLVERDLQKPNSLIELSRKAGINDYKLKKGFKELTGHTVFGYLYKIRMEKAHYFLSKEKKSVNEVAFLVGYKNAQHFIAAFKKQYQILPGSLNKS